MYRVTGGWMIFTIFRLFKSILFLVNWIILYFFLYLLKSYHIMFIIISFWLGSGRLDLFTFVPALLLSMSRLSSYLIRLFLLSYFIRAVPIRECLGKHSCMSFTFSIAILNCTCFFLIVQLQVHNAHSEGKNRNAWTQVNPNL